MGHESGSCADVSEAAPEDGKASGGQTTQPSGTTGNEPSSGNVAGSNNTVQVNPYTGDADYRAPGTIANPDTLPPGTVLNDGSVVTQSNPFVE